ncbi:hypothetical protein SteCoe_27676 [Stentor coeruleus]|uniref:Uncharacterized protein n=1 Tax=Stentor coeruleus TaxID=5963 RepID=A0A1R2BAH7_9CILI|nr:hypothetical protein SteCoe_27676 [Stentor coeruleus]
MDSSAVFQEIELILQRIGKNVNSVNFDSIPSSPGKSLQFKMHHKTNGSRSSFASKSPIPSSPHKNPIHGPCRLLRNQSAKHSLKNQCQALTKSSTPNKFHHESSEKPENPNFHPNTNENSKKLLKKTPKTQQKRWVMLYEDSHKKKEKLVNARRLNREKDLYDKECTFKPIIHQSSKPEQDIVTRTYNWLRIKNAKITSKAEADFDKDLKECTFTPQINEFKEKNEVLVEINGLQQVYRHHVTKAHEGDIKQISEPIKNKDLSVKEYKKAVKNLNKVLHSIDIKY